MDADNYEKMSIEIHVREPNDFDRRYINMMKWNEARYVGDYTYPNDTMTQCCCGELSQWVTFVQQPDYTQMICPDCRTNEHPVLKKQQRVKRLFFNIDFKPLHAIYVRNEEHEAKMPIIRSLSIVRR